MNNDEFNEILKKIEAYEVDLIFQYESERNLVHVFWYAPMTMQIGVIEFRQLMNGWYFKPNMTGLKDFNARQLVSLGVVTNELNRIAHQQNKIPVHGD